METQSDNFVRAARNGLFFSVPFWVGAIALLCCSGCSLLQPGAIEALGTEVAQAAAAVAEVEEGLEAVKESGWGAGEITALSGGLSGLALIGSRILSIMKHGPARTPPPAG